MDGVKNFTEFKNELLSNPNLQQAFKEDPIKAVQQFHQIIPDSWVYRLVVGALGLSILLVILGIVFLSFSGRNVDPNITTLFTAIASGAVGALAGLLSPSPKN